MAKRRKSKLSDIALNIGQQVTSADTTPIVEEPKVEKKNKPAEKKKNIPKTKAKQVVEETPKKKKLTNKDYQKRYRKKVKILYISEKHHQIAKKAAEDKRQTIRVFIESLIEDTQK